MSDKTEKKGIDVEAPVSAHVILPQDHFLFMRTSIATATDEKTGESYEISLTGWSGAGNPLIEMPDQSVVEFSWQSLINAAIKAVEKAKNPQGNADADNVERVARDLYEWIDGVLNKNWCMELPADLDRYKERFAALGVVL